MNIDKQISNYLDHISQDYTIEGCLICGSYINGTYNKDSDLDILFIVPGHDFKMKLEIFEGILFDRILADPYLLLEIINSGSAIGDILSYSFGSSNKILINNDSLSKIIQDSQSNISNKKLTYKKSPNKQKKTVDGHAFYILKKNGSFFLFKNGKKIT